MCRLRLITALALLIVLGAGGALAGADRDVILPLLCTFDADTPDSPPAIGGPDQPTSLLVPPDGFILVRSEANGIATQPCEIYDGGAMNHGAIIFTFGLVDTGILRVEATTSFDHYVNGYFLQTVSSTGIVVNRYLMTDAGVIQDHFGIPIGSYVAGQPFRVRMDINLVDDFWVGKVDDEMDGFANDTPVGGLQFVNNPAILDGVAGVWCSLCTGGAQPTTYLAYDDISAELLDTPVAPGSWSSVKDLYQAP